MKRVIGVQEDRGKTGRGVEGGGGGRCGHSRRNCKLRCKVVCEEKKPPVKNRMCQSLLQCAPVTAAQSVALCRPTTADWVARCDVVRLVVVVQANEHATDVVRCQYELKCYKEKKNNSECTKDDGGEGGGARRGRLREVGASTASSSAPPRCGQHGCVQTSACRAFARKCPCSQCGRAICLREKAMGDERKKKEKAEKRKKEQDCLLPHRHYHCHCHCHYHHHHYRHHNHDQNHSSQAHGCGCGCSACCGSSACQKMREEEANKQKEEEKNRKKKEKGKKEEEHRQLQQGVICSEICTPYGMAWDHDCLDFCI